MISRQRHTIAWRWGLVVALCTGTSLIAQQEGGGGGDVQHEARLPSTGTGRQTDATYSGASALTTPLAEDSTLGGASGYTASRPYRDSSPNTPYVPPYSADGQYRRPRCSIPTDAGDLLVATRGTGEILLISSDGKRVERLFGPSASGFVAICRIESSRYAVADALHHRVLLFEQTADGWRLNGELVVPGAPSSLGWDRQRGVLWVGAQWARRLHACRLSFQDKATNDSRDRFAPVSESFIDVEFCPGPMLLLEHHQVLLVADAFGNRFAVIDVERQRVLRQGTFYGHDVPALAATDDETMVFYPHRLLNEFARSVTTDITWGGMLSNNIRWLQTERLLHVEGEAMFRQGKFFPLGSPGNGAADPTDMDVAHDGRIAVTLGGTNRVAVLRQGEFYFDQFVVGLHPVDCQFSQDAQQLWVVNEFSDTVSLIDLPAGQVRHIALGPLRPPTLAERGEQLFYDATLSHDGWMSCHSCHTDGHTCGLLNDNFSDGSFGTPKRVLSLLGQRFTSPFAWNGSVPHLAAQVRQSVKSTMAGDRELEDLQVSALVAFLDSLPVPPSVRAARQGGGAAADAAHVETRWLAAQQAAAQGFRVFEQRGCVHCHPPPHFTSPETYDVGLHDEQGAAQFNPPSLLGVSQRQEALFHDGSARSLDDVFKAQHQLDSPLSDEEREALIDFLLAL
ncbi:MAG: hypothetical protein KatS3mg111_2208 [Pirellulaceae bacterium]|nr:MAG: hypothetical protein KatS3mg111_2208 [Pirellulaceae bacterium]